MKTSQPSLPPDQWLSDRDFRRFQKLIYDRAGIFLAPVKKTLLAGRLAGRLRALGLRSFSEYYERIAQGGEDELIEMLDRVSTNETRFFRHPQQFEFLVQRVFPRWSALAADGMRNRHLRAWSAGCSTGEEAYSLAMFLASHFLPQSGWSYEVLASDLSLRALSTARAGIYPIEKSAQLPEPFLKSWMLRGIGSQQGVMKVRPEIASHVRFERINLHDAAYQVDGRFDLIFCSNVLIYFDAQSRAAVLERLLNHLQTDGLLMVGQSERVLMKRAVSVGPNAYALGSNQEAVA